MTEGARGPPPLGPGWKLALRLLVTGALLGVLAWKAPNPEEIIPDDHLQTFAILAAAVLVAFLALSCRRGAGSGCCACSTAAFRLRPDQPLPRRHVRGQRAPVDDGGDVVRVTRVGLDRVLERRLRLRRPGTLYRLRRCRCWCSQDRDPSQPARRRPCVDCLVSRARRSESRDRVVRRRSPADRGPFAEHENWMRLIGAVHRRQPAGAGASPGRPSTPCPARRRRWTARCP